ncbi:unnamed protein product [Medioppia subpectinata]|uniref:GH16 domain-containing protein n=1 Tax=Medioppia subpectinata TaxID=1979941 RepID=A0A7R9L2Z7_9ACAR|nr:unnamed protein product [Medioppia subpectinata]CAG2114334.1 unnamed protein product [Medioppia subpectinata]
MKIKIISIALLIYYAKCEEKLHLVWSEEFNDKELDPNVWEVEDEWQSGNCFGNHIGQLNCNVNQSRNLQLIDGCLAITAAHEKENVLEKEYTSAKIKTKKGWTYGRFEIRAALPKGKMLRPVMVMESLSPGQWAIAGQIDIMTNIQTQGLGNGVHFSTSPAIYKPVAYEYIAKTRLNQFHTYAPFVGKPFKIAINLGVGGNFFPNQVLNINDFYDWECSALIVDYVRVYQMKRLMQTNRQTDSVIYEENYADVLYDNNYKDNEYSNPAENYYSRADYAPHLGDANDPDPHYLMLTDKYAQQNLSNASINSSKNLQLIDGCLAITAAHEKENVLEKEYTSAKIKTKKGWTYGRFEIRAALPKGKMLRPVMVMESLSPGQWAIAGQIDIMTNIQTQGLGNGVHFSTSPAIYKPTAYEYIAKTRLNQFHTYAVEWHKSHIKWFFDDINHLTFNLSEKLSSHYTRNGEPFVGKPFKIAINLGVGGNFFPNQVLSINDFHDWECSALIVDYVRVYQMKRLMQTNRQTDSVIHEENYADVLYDNNYKDNEYSNPAENYYSRADYMPHLGDANDPDPHYLMLTDKYAQQNLSNASINSSKL